MYLICVILDFDYTEETESEEKIKPDSEDFQSSRMNHDYDHYLCKDENCSKLYLTLIMNFSTTGHGTRWDFLEIANY